MAGGPAAGGGLGVGAGGERGEQFGEAVQHRGGGSLAVPVQQPAVEGGLVLRADRQALGRIGGRRERERERGPGDRAAGGGGDGAVGAAEPVHGVRQHVGRVGAGADQRGQLPPGRLGDRRGVLRPGPQAAPEPQVHPVGDGAEAGAGRYDEQRDAVRTAGVGQARRYGAVGALARHQRGDPGAAQGGREAQRRRGVAGLPPDEAGEDEFAGLQVAGRVLEVGGRHAGDRAAQQLGRAPGQLDLQIGQLQQVSDDHASLLVLRAGPSAPWLADASVRCAQAS